MKLQTTFNIWIYYVNWVLGMAWETANYIGISRDSFQNNKLKQQKLQTTSVFYILIEKFRGTGF